MVQANLMVLVFVVLSIGLSLLVNALFLKFSTNLGTRNKEGLVRWSAQVKPSVGGFSFFFCFLLSVVAAALTFGQNNPMIPFLGLVGACTLGFLIGLADDAYNTKPALKFSGQIVCGLIVWFSGNGISLTGLEGVDFALTLLWVAGLMNSLNMLDNMDGITTVVSLMIILGMALFAALGPLGFFQPDVWILLGMAGGLLGFLYYNWSPARIYMGDTGSMFIGVFLAVFSIKLHWNASFVGPWHTLPGHLLVIWLPFVVPVADTLTVSINRILSGKSPFVGGRDHTTHHLAYSGFKERHIAALYAMLSLAGSTLVIILTQTDESLIWFVSAIGLLVVTLALYLTTKGKHGPATSKS
jgi:UDP-GlcNAc:undecaprenyl-phosphate GlcNAc-1-phosphate transferase